MRTERTRDVTAIDVSSELETDGENRARMAETRVTASRGDAAVTGLAERMPSGRGWTSLGYHAVAGGTVWQNGSVRAVSSLHLLAELPDGSGHGPQWHVSISDGGARPHRHTVRQALRDFGMVGAEEDNHHPGNARHFWMPVDSKHRVDCECKVEEQTIVDPDGYKWTNPKPETGEACRGCDIVEITGRPCPIHGSPKGAGADR